MRAAGLGAYALLLVGGASLLTTGIASAMGGPSQSAVAADTFPPPAEAPTRPKKDATTPPKPTKSATPVRSAKPKRSTARPAPTTQEKRPAAKPARKERPARRPSSNKAEIAVQYAMRQLGKPYVWGATGPGSFDCSGLTMRAYQAAGISLPRTARQQSYAGRAVSTPRRGDLVVSNGRGHIAIAIGNGRVIESPQPGMTVRISPMPRDIVSIVRIV